MRRPSLLIVPTCAVGGRARGRMCSLSH